ncbi:p25-alpha-domain-containing protein [Polychytrium aggregatum]|uniref:p25-alpha-domain-containing protein n=1 Tax=Polychytrium aggregatum TaxID=110093 RepID=UPI0022FF3A3F|nr:p25-alpha-domain-containing protein [Polychytrium aggregatum]KAI9199861.1 p25-alpha-domain-containing protein [Polychytrium aggregatum]
MATVEDLRSTYETFCSFGSSRNLSGISAASMDLVTGPTMDGAKFAKFCRDSGLVEGKAITSTDVDIIFNKAKAKGARRLDWNTFLEACRLLSEKKYPAATPAEGWSKFLNDVVYTGKGPVVSGTTASTEGIYEKLTNTSLYTGTHKSRFDANGKGLGLAGRDAPSKTNRLDTLVNRDSKGPSSTLAGSKPGSMSNLSSAPKPLTAKRGQVAITTVSSEKIDSEAHKTKKAPESTLTSTAPASGVKVVGKSPSTKSVSYAAVPSTSSGSGSVFDRLTDTNQYTGSHKLRFNADGTGRGLAGRDSTPKGQNPGTYRGGDVKDLSQILRN